MTPAAPGDPLRQAQVATLVSDELQQREDWLFMHARFRDRDRSLDRIDFDFNKKIIGP